MLPVLGLNLPSIQLSNLGSTLFTLFIEILYGDIEGTDCKAERSVSVAQSSFQNRESISPICEFSRLIEDVRRLRL